jgi:hypothetical protein
MRYSRAMPRLACSLLLILLVCLPGPAQQVQPPSQADLDAISMRGEMLWESDEAAWHSTDAVQALRPPEASVRGYFPLKTNKGWQVAYGRQNETGDKFLIAYLATQATAPDKFNVETFTPPKEDSGFFLFAAKVRSVAQKDFGGANRPYNIAVLPADAGKFYVYVYPAQTVSAVYPLGGDVRYLISADGTTIIEKHQMHKSILETDMRNQPKGTAKTVAGFHTHILSDVPEDTDVFHVLTEQPRVPEMIGTEHFIYAVNESGAIRIVDKHKSKK